MSYAKACAASELELDKPFSVDVNGTLVAIVQTDDGLFAIYDECSHARVMLSLGEVESDTLECFAHGSRFDLASGYPLDLPATRPGPVYPVKIEGDDVLVDLDNPIETQEP